MPIPLCRHLRCRFSPPLPATATGRHGLCRLASVLFLVLVLPRLICCHCEDVSAVFVASLLSDLLRRAATSASVIVASVAISDASAAAAAVGPRHYRDPE